MIFPRRWVIGFCLVLTFFCLMSGGKLAGEEIGDLEFIIEPPATNDSHHGYSEFRITVTNRSPLKPHVVSLYLPHNGYNYSNELQEIRRTAEVPPKTTRIFSLYQPPLEINGNNLGVSIDGETLQDGLHMPSFSHIVPYYYYSNAKACILISPGLQKDDFQLIDSTGKRQEKDEKYSIFRSEVPIKQWSPNWLGYTRYDGIVLTAENLDQMLPEVKAVMFRYVESGGCLTVLGQWTTPATWQIQEKSPLGISVLQGGLGKCLIFGETHSRELTFDQKRELCDLWGETGKPFRSYRSPEDANNAFPIVEGIGVPIRGLLFLMFGFSLVIGPVNLMFLSRINRRIWVLWTVPLISLVTCLTVFFYAVTGEGWGTLNRMELFTYIDENSQRASTIGWLAFYSPLSQSEGLHFSMNTELNPQIQKYSRRGTPRFINWDQDQHLSEGWISARVPSHFLVRKSESRHERLNLRVLPDGNLAAVNGLGAGIRKLFVLDTGLRFYTAQAIGPGKEAVLRFENHGAAHRRPFHALKGVYEGNWLNLADHCSKNPLSYLEPGTYIALLDGHPFIEVGMPSNSNPSSSSVVYGVLKGSNHEG